MFFLLLYRVNLLQELTVSWLVTSLQSVRVRIDQLAQDRNRI